MIDVYGVPLGISGGCLCGVQWRRRVDASPLCNDGLGPWGEAEEAPVGASLGNVRVHQVEKVSRIQMEPPALDGLPPVLLLLVAAEIWAFVLQGAHGCFMRSRAVRVAAVALYVYASWVCPLAVECPFCRWCPTPGHVPWLIWGYCVKTGGQPCLLVSSGGGGGGVIVGGHEVQ